MNSKSTSFKGKGSRFLLVLAGLAIISLTLIAWDQNWFRPAPETDFSGPTAGWDQWGNDAGGTHFSPLTQIDKANVSYLKPAWVYNIGEIRNAPPNTSPTLEVTPIIAAGKMFVCAGDGRIAAIDPETGKEIWKHDPKSDYAATYLLNCRGVTYVEDSEKPKGQRCHGRILSGTQDGRMVALDANTGNPCTTFGADGVVDLKEDSGSFARGDLGIPSPPVVVSGKIIVNTRIPDNVRIDVPAGVIRAFDVHSGKLAWAWNPLPPGMTDEEHSRDGEKYVRATPNSWAPMSSDPELGLVYVPMGNAAPDHFAAIRDGRDYYSSAVVALDAATGDVKWHFKTAHHDVWDYDVPAQPVLFTMQTANGPVPALAQTTKQGFIFVLDRRTGEPLFPVEERPVPQKGKAPDEQLSPTQPFPANPAFIIKADDFTEDDMWGFTPWDKGKCRKLFKSVNYEGIYTPPSTDGWLQFPSFMGASNWGGISIDEKRGILIANTTQVPAIMELVPAADIPTRTQAGEMILPSEGSPYGNKMRPMLSPFGAPCNRPPWGTLLAIDMNKGKRLWEVPLGTTRDQAPFPFWMKLGVPNMGGTLITESGLVFIGATTDNYLRAYDIKTGQVLWRTRLPGGGQATPMTYRLRKNGRQFVVIAAGGHRYLGTKTGDAIVAFALPN